MTIIDERRIGGSWRSSTAGYARTVRTRERRREYAKLEADGFYWTASESDPTLLVTDDGKVYIGGMTTSSEFPSARAAQYGASGRQDGFVTMIRPRGAEAAAYNRC
ncbi:MAG TPA: hypothetical protein VEX68_01870 [Bryobacteraceae bacterium]|nr:hypothetical protein [Bryobacteraceae bacterium]